MEVVDDDEKKKKSATITSPPQQVSSQPPSQPAISTATTTTNDVLLLHDDCNDKSCLCIKPGAFLPPGVSLEQPPLPKRDETKPLLRRAQEEASTFSVSTFYGDGRGYKYNRNNGSNNKKFAVLRWDGGKDESTGKKKKGEVRSTELVSPTLVALSANLITHIVQNNIMNEQFDSVGDFAYACVVDTYVLNRSVGIDNAKAIGKVLPSVAAYVESMKADLGKIRKKVTAGIVDFDAAQEKRFAEVSAFIDKLESTECKNFVELALKKEDVPTFPWMEEPEDALQPCE